MLINSKRFLDGPEPSVALEHIQSVMIGIRNYPVHSVPLGVVIDFFLVDRSDCGVVGFGIF